MLCNLANQMLCTKLQHFALSAGKAKLLSSTCLCYASLEASFCFWLVHAMFPEGTFDSDQYFDHEVLAQLTLHCMERGQYTRAAKFLLSGLSDGVMTVISTLMLTNSFWRMLQDSFSAAKT